jgi:hypothetical protein
MGTPKLTDTVLGVQYEEMKDPAVKNFSIDDIVTLAVDEIVTPTLQTVTAEGANTTVQMQINGVNVATVNDIQGSNILKNIKVTLTSAQLLNLFTTPIELVPAVTGKLLIPQFLFQKYNHVSSAYTTSGSFRIGLGSITFGFSAFSAVITSADNAQGLNNFSYSQSTSGLTYQNLPIVVGATTANPTGGNGTLDLYLTYLEVTL